MKMKIETDKYAVTYNSNVRQIEFAGTLRIHELQKEYEEIIDLFDKILSDENNHITLRLSKLFFLNSLGISMLSKFIIKIRNTQRIQMTVVAGSAIPWQSKSLKNLQRLMPNLELKWI